MPQSHTPVVGDHCTFLSLSCSDCNHSKCDRHCLETGCLPPVQCLVIKSGQPEVEGGVLNLLPTSWLLQLLAISCRMQTNSIPIIPSRKEVVVLLYRLLHSLFSSDTTSYWMTSLNVVFSKAGRCCERTPLCTCS